MNVAAYPTNGKGNRTNSSDVLKNLQSLIKIYVLYYLTEYKRQHFTKGFPSIFIKNHDTIK